MTDLLTDHNYLNTMLIGFVLIVLLFVSIGVWRIDQRSKGNTKRIDRIEGDHRQLERQLNDIPTEIGRQIAELRRDQTASFVRIENRIDDWYKSGK